MITLLSLETEITKEQCFKHISFPFTIRNDYRKLVIKFSYSPKKFDGDSAYALALGAFEEAYGTVRVSKEEVSKELPLNNHVTLSVLREGIIMGTAHRHANDMVLEIDADSATEGFHPFNIKKGEYQIVLSTHAVLSQKINVRLEVEAYE